MDVVIFEYDNLKTPKDNGRMILEWIQANPDSRILQILAWSNRLTIFFQGPSNDV